MAEDEIDFDFKEEEKEEKKDNLDNLSEKVEKQAKFMKGFTDVTQLDYITTSLILGEILLLAYGLLALF